MGELLGEHVWRATALFERFAAARPAAPDHYYLSLFGTRPERRGQGLGWLCWPTTWPGSTPRGWPAYLESTNPANLERYRSVGFVDPGAFALPGDGPTVTTMWREPRPPPDGPRGPGPVSPGRVAPTSPDQSGGLHPDHRTGVGGVDHEPVARRRCPTWSTPAGPVPKNTRSPGCTVPAGHRRAGVELVLGHPGEPTPAAA